MSYIGTNGGNPRVSQALPASRYRAARPKIPQIALHTSESFAGQLLAALWGFLNVRTDHGSYNAGADVHGTANQYAPWSWYTWHAIAVNPFACGLAANCRADEWDRISTLWRTNLIKGLARLAHQYSLWCVSQGLGPVPARRLTKTQALAGAHGFVYHGALQSDRTDPTGPRDVFPWKEFLAEFIRLERGGTTPTPPKKEPKMSWTTPIKSLVTNEERPVSTLMQHTHRNSQRAADALLNLIRTPIRSAVSGALTTVGNVWTDTHLRVRQTLSGVNEVREQNAVILESLGTLEKLVGGQGEIKRRIDALPSEIEKARQLDPEPVDAEAYGELKDLGEKEGV